MKIWSGDVASAERSPHLSVNGALARVSAATGHCDR